MAGYNRISANREAKTQIERGMGEYERNDNTPIDSTYSGAYSARPLESMKKERIVVDSTPETLESLVKDSKMGHA